MIKKILLVLILIFLLTVSLSPPATTNAAEQNLTVYFFYSESCPHCHDALDFFELIKHKYPEVSFQYYEVSQSKENYILYSDVAAEFGGNSQAVPATFIGDQAIIGFDNATRIGAKMENKIKSCLDNPCINPAEQAGLLTPSTPAKQNTNSAAVLPNENSDKNENNNKELLANSAETIEDSVNYPFLGELKLKNLSLPVLSIALGSLDGFNPCAMWALITLLTLLINTKSKKRIWLVGGIFILVSGILYFLFISAWLNAFLFIGYLAVSRIIIGLIAIGAGIYFLRDFFVNKSATCKVTPSKTKKRLTEKMKKIVTTAALPATIVGVIAVAFTVNLIELLCTAGLPAIFTQILSLNDLPTWSYYGYIALYVLFYMLDDLIIFIIAAYTLSIFGFTGKYSRYMRLIGGIIILVLGFILILKPELLTFG